MLNKKILNYRITHEIGSGGMATVYEAIHTKLDTKVAIKVLDPLLASNESIRQRFMQEAKIMASLNHDGITKVVDFDDEGSHLAIIMEFLEGQTLDEYVKQKGALNEEQAKVIFIPILEAFAYAHKKGIVHRDVKPSNIFITTEGKVKIMDFGIAKLVEDGSKMLTQTGAQMGTPTYMSPEQVHDSKHIDHRTDIYSLGVTLWFMLAGKPPYDADKNSSFDIFMKINGEPLPELTKYPGFDKTIKLATKKDKDNRFDSCEKFNKTVGTSIDINTSKLYKETDKEYTNIDRSLYTVSKSEVTEINFEKEDREAREDFTQVNAKTDNINNDSQKAIFIKTTSDSQVHPTPEMWKEEIERCSDLKKVNSAEKADLIFEFRIRSTMGEARISVIVYDATDKSKIWESKKFRGTVNIYNRMSASLHGIRKCMKKGIIPEIEKGTF